MNTTLTLSPRSLRPMEARLQSELPDEPGWQYEPKWDGFRCLAFKNEESVDLRAKSGKSLARYFPEIVKALGGLSAERLVLDGELLIPIGDALSFDALQMRLHPAQSRIDKLAIETPSLLMCFDMLEDTEGEVLIEECLTRRRRALETFFAGAGKVPSLRLSPCTRDRSDAQKWLGNAGRGALDGVVAKKLDEPYRPGERAMLKVKCLRTADCVVGGFRYESGSRLVGSMLLGLYNDSGKLDHIGFTSGISNGERKELTRKLLRLRGGKGFSGNAPGGPSRWSTERSGEWIPVKPLLVAEVRYDHVTGGRFRHGTKFLRWRPDKAPKQCTSAQLAAEGRPSRIFRRVLAR